MALFDFLKRKKEIEKALGRSKTGEAKAVSKGDEPRPKKFGRDKTDKPVKSSPVHQKSLKSKKTTVFSYDIVKEPHISEKATILSENNRYVFKVYPNTNKIDIKKAVEGVYGVDVLSVNIIKIPKKKRRLGKVQGFRAGYSKAVVKVKDGQKIEIL